MLFRVLCALCAIISVRCSHCILIIDEDKKAKVGFVKVQRQTGVIDILHIMQQIIDEGYHAVEIDCIIHWIIFIISLHFLS